MQYRRQNFIYNIIMAAGADNDLAWTNITHEINELALDDKLSAQGDVVSGSASGGKIKLADLLAKNGVAVGVNPTAYQLATWALKGVFESKEIRAGLLQLILERHQDPFINSKGGVYDKSPEGNTPENAAKAIDKMVADNKKPVSDRTNALVADLKRKQDQRGISVSIIDRLRNQPVKTAVGILAVAGVIFVVCKYFSNRKTQI